MSLLKGILINFWCLRAIPFLLLADNASQLAVDQITSLQLNISIVWLGERLPFTILENKVRGKPLLFYTWDPDPLTLTGDFRRISFPDCKWVYRYFLGLWDYFDLDKELQLFGECRPASLITTT